MNRQNGRRMMKGSGFLFVFFILFCLLNIIVIPALSLADNEGSPPNDAMVDSTGGEDAGADTYGLSGLIRYTLTPWDFRPISSDVTYEQMYTPTTIYRTNAAGDVWFQAPLHLPSGAKIVQFDIQYCDTGTLLFSAALQVHNIATGTVSPNVILLTSSGTPGCIIETVYPAAAQVTIDNNTNLYILQANLGGTGTAGDSTIRLGAVRVGYKLQVSPAPATATFPIDVPTSHPFFRFIEALAAAGITGGCGAGQFCPNDAVTRGQMAVFLSAALGLHWPN